MPNDDDMRALFKKAGNGDPRAIRKIYGIVREDDVNAERRVLGLRFDPRVSVGNLVAICIIVVGGIGTYFTVREQITKNTDTLYRQQVIVEKLVDLSNRQLTTNDVQDVRLQTIQNDLENIKRSLSRAPN